MPVQPRVPKPEAERAKECLNVLSKIVDELKIPTDNPSVALLNKRMLAYVNDGKTQEERIPLVGSNRYILYRLPRWAHQQVEVVLRVGRITHSQLPPDLMEELRTSSNNGSQSALAPSPQQG
jgi:hypothetical protein